MSKIKSKTWNTKHGACRVRHEVPTLEEAIAAAQGLSDKLNEQTEIAAALIGLPRDHVHAELLKVTGRHKDVVKSVVSRGAGSTLRTIVVERKDTRRLRRHV
jgi:hypothetical protein